MKTRLVAFVFVIAGLNSATWALPFVCKHEYFPSDNTCTTNCFRDDVDPLTASPTCHQSVSGNCDTTSDEDANCRYDLQKKTWVCKDSNGDVICEGEAQN